MSDRLMTRRSVLLGAVGLAGAAATGGAWLATSQDPAAGDARILASSDAVRRAEQLRLDRGTGRTVRATMTAEQAEVDLGGRVVSTWAYNGQVPGPVLRCTAGDQLQVDLRNRLPESTTVHWHGLRLRNDMDGVPQLTQSPVGTGQTMRYSFTAPDPGTYWFHPHMGLQRERGLFAPLIIDDPREAGGYDVEFVVVLDDWIDGTGATPDQVLETLRQGDAMARYSVPVQAGQIPDQSQSWQYHATQGMTNPPGGMPADSPASRLADSIDFPFYLLNGRLPTAPQSFEAKPGQRARIRLINAAGATVFRVALGGHQLTVTHTDGFPVEPITVDTLQIASGERYDLLVTLGDGVFPLVAVAEGKGAQALGLVRTASGPVPPPTAAPAELAGRLLAYTDLRATPDVRVPTRTPDATHTVYLTGDMMSFAWRINAETYNHRRPFSGITPLPIQQGQQVRLALINQTPMYHPMHVHGHSFVIRSVGEIFSDAPATAVTAGAIKDTLQVAPGERIDVDFTADNPGQWLTHCHNAYHMATGMATILSYLAPS